MNKEQLHDYHVNRLNLNPTLIKLDRNGEHELSDIVMSGTVNFLDEGRLIAQPDGFLVNKWGELFLFEYKISRHFREASKQLRTQGEFIKKYRGAFIGLPDKYIFICGKNNDNKGYVVQEVRV